MKKERIIQMKNNSLKVKIKESQIKTLKLKVNENLEKKFIKWNKSQSLIKQMSN